MDDDIIQVGGGIYSVGTQHPIHEVLENGLGPEQAERKCDKLEQTEEGLFLLSSSGDW